MARGEAYLDAKFHLDPSNRLATIHQRYRQDRQTDNGEPFYKRSHKNWYHSHSRLTLSKKGGIEVAYRHMELNFSEVIGS